MFDEYNLWGMFNGDALDISTIIERLKGKGIKDLKYVTVEGAELSNGEFRHQISLWKDKPTFNEDLTEYTWGVVHGIPGAQEEFERISIDCFGDWALDVEILGVPPASELEAFNDCIWEVE